MLRGTHTAFNKETAKAISHLKNTVDIENNSFRRESKHSSLNRRSITSSKIDDYMKSSEAFKKLQQKKQRRDLIELQKEKNKINRMSMASNSNQKDSSKKSNSRRSIKG